MEANELRIGNYINTNGNFVKVGKIEEKNISWKITKGNVSIWNPFVSPNHEQIKPIDLTEEILLKCGFEKKSWFTNSVVIERIYYQKGNFIVYLLKKSFEVELVSDSRQFNLFKNFKKELHILQNLYLLLENKELTINL